MIPEATIQAAIGLLARQPEVERVILFGSYATGAATEDSDLDLLVIETTLKSRRAEMVRLRASLRPLGIPVDVLVAGADQYEAWKDQPGTALYEAAQHGLVVYERAS